MFSKYFKNPLTDIAIQIGNSAKKSYLFKHINYKITNSLKIF